MTTFNLPSIFFTLVGLVFPAIVCASLFLFMLKKINYLAPNYFMLTRTLEYNT
uniref:Photosystem I reaction center subunit VIII n=1 Tax=Lennoa madreporoides TaxID=111108 RepID=A0A385GMV7_9ASTE|nr:photosystem I subunit VIII [Lennoa madreporoides]AXX75990.1 photosystem I subunit VIII [Lennoa madreporoides]